MTLPRGLLITAMIGALAVGVITLRQAMASTSYRIQQQHQRRVRLEQELWGRQMELARLRIPSQVKQRVDDMGLEIELPRIERRAAHQNGAMQIHD